MTRKIDAADFVAQGKPTIAQAHEVWDSIRNPSARKVASALQKRGYKISWRTIARWHSDGWANEKANKVGAILANRIPNAKLHPAVEKAMKAECEEIAESGEEGDFSRALTTPIDASVEDIQKRIDAMMLQSEGDLDLKEAKIRKIANILLMEEAARRAAILILVPKDTAALVSAMTEAAGARLTGGYGQPPMPGDPRTIEGDARRLEMEKAVESNETVDELTRFLRDAGRRVA